MPAATPPRGEGQDCGARPSRPRGGGPTSGSAVPGSSAEMLGNTPRPAGTRLAFGSRLLRLEARLPVTRPRTSMCKPTCTSRVIRSARKRSSRARRSGVILERSERGWGVLADGGGAIAPRCERERDRSRKRFASPSGKGESNGRPVIGRSQRGSLVPGDPPCALSSVALRKLRNQPLGGAEGFRSSAVRASAPRAPGREPAGRRAPSRSRGSTGAALSSTDARGIRSRRATPAGPAAPGR